MVMDMSPEAKRIQDRLLQKGIDLVDRFNFFEAAGEVVREEREAWERAVRQFADELWREGKGLVEADPDKGKLLKVICTNLHRMCQVVKGEEPLPAPGSPLTE